MRGLRERCPAERGRSSLDAVWWHGGLNGPDWCSLGVLGWCRLGCAGLVQAWWAWGLHVGASWVGAALCRSSCQLAAWHGIARLGQLGLVRAGVHAAHGLVRAGVHAACFRRSFVALGWCGLVCMLCSAALVRSFFSAHCPCWCWSVLFEGFTQVVQLSGEEVPWMLCGGMAACMVCRFGCMGWCRLCGYGA